MAPRPHRPRGGYGAGAAKNTNRVTLYLPEEMVDELDAESKRQGRSLSWLAQRAWKIAKKKIQELPTEEEPP